VVIMKADPLASVWSLLRALRDAFSNASPIANAITIFTALVALASSVGLYVQRRLKSARGRIETLERQYANLLVLNDGLHARLERCDKEYDDLRKRQPEHALATFDKEWSDGNYEPATKPVTDWLQNDGVTISKLLIRRADWAVAHASGDDMRPSGLTAAQAYARAAITFWPENWDAMFLLADVTKMIEEDGRTSPSIQEALPNLDRCAAQAIYRGDDVGVAQVAEKQALYWYQRGYYRAALATIDWALMLSVSNSGRQALRTRQTQHLKAVILNSLGRYDEALNVAEEIARAREAHPSLGSRHPDTLASRHLVAQILHNLGRNQEALPIAQEVAEATQADPSLGPAHPHSVAGRYLVSQILQSLGRNQEALPVAQEVVRAREAQPSLGPGHPDTLRSRWLVAHILQLLGRNEEALPIAQEVARAQELHPSLGPTHPETLASRHVVAEILSSLGRNEEALPIAQDVARAQELQPSLGPTHPGTLASRYLVAHILQSLGRSQEALPIAQDVARTSEAHSSLVPPTPVPWRAATLWPRYSTR